VDVHLGEVSADVVVAEILFKKKKVTLTMGQQVI